MLGFFIPGEDILEIFHRLEAVYYWPSYLKVDVDSTFFRVPYHQEDPRVECEGCPIRKVNRRYL